MHTHDVTITDDLVRKCYVSWDDGEPDREWAALQHLAREAPDLTPAPIGRETRDNPAGSTEDQARHLLALLDQSLLSK